MFSYALFYYWLAIGINKMDLDHEDLVRRINHKREVDLENERLDRAEKSATPFMIAFCVLGLIAVIYSLWGGK